MIALTANGTRMACGNLTQGAFICNLSAIGIHFRNIPTSFALFMYPPDEWIGPLNANFTLQATNFAPASFNPNLTVIATVYTKAEAVVDPKLFYVGRNVSVSYVLYTSAYQTVGEEQIWVPVSKIMPGSRVWIDLDCTNPLVECYPAGDFVHCNLSVFDIRWNNSGSAFCVHFSPVMTSILAVNAQFQFH
eukprot:RCo044243